MCGIAGKLSARDPVDRELIEQMCRVIDHRGPDSRGVYVEENLGLGVQRLAVIDLKTGNQPLFNEDGSIVVVLNGEIYNYRELREDLTARGHYFRSQTDTEVLVHLYEEHGRECVHHLRGMFAFALWDRRRRTLFLARDRVGKKPLYYAFDGESFWFASEAKAILQDPAVPRHVDEAAIDAFLQYKYVPHEYCAFAALKKVPAAHTLVLHDGGLQLQRYWKLSYVEDPLSSDEEICELVRHELLAAVQLRLRSDVPLGVFLSGGVDSSAVLAAAAQNAHGRLQTFTIGFAAQSFDERPHAREIARLFDTEHSEFVLEPDVVELLPRLAWHYSEPFADQSAVPTFYLAAATRRRVTVALSGDGGDENFGGYPRYLGNDLAARLAAVPPRLARFAEAALRLTGEGPAENGTRAQMLRLLHALPLDPVERYVDWLSCFSEPERFELYTPALRDRMRESGDASGVVRGAYLASDARTLIERLLDVDTQSFLVDQLLVKMDVASMAHSLEVRSPLLDHVFMQMAARLPLSAKVAGRTTKRLLKQAIRAWVPETLLDRPKQGFTMPLSHWLRGELSELPRLLLLDERARGRGLFCAAAVERLINDHKRGTRDNGRKLWALIQLELWFRTYVDVRPKGPIALDLIDVAHGGTYGHSRKMSQSQRPL
jgi:asparagine synthase (glutamine-hydrolysing)